MIFDCFIFFNEFELLEIRLNELNDVVDKFVLVEATKTHQGKDKPLYFEENKKQFSDFLNKIIHIAVGDYPKRANPLQLEYHQRNKISEGLNTCLPEDQIIISDIDEIPRPAKIIEAKELKGIKIFEQQMFYYFMNCLNVSNIGGNKTFKWYGPIMADFKYLKTPQKWRDICVNLMGVYHPNPLYQIYGFLYYNLLKVFNRNPIHVIKDGGWHFSYLGGVEKIIEKIESFHHKEYNVEEYKNPDKIEKAINNGRDIFGRKLQYQFVKLDSTFPKYILENEKKFNHLIRY
jgi:beta-1,4-mannosyl-glycoprotein beta-1,4-N-acetylglucosaminyltransferase